MEPLISNDEFTKAIGMERFSSKSLNQMLTKIFKIDEVNKLYSEAFDLDTERFIENTLKNIGVQVDYLDKELENIPSKGPFIVVSNHPYGAIDGLILIYLLLKKRPDFKIMGNFLLHKIKPLLPYLLPVNPFGKNIKTSSYSGTKNAIKELKNGACVGIFPAGEVSSFQKFKTITDSEWKSSVIKLIKNADVPVVPIYFHGSNSIAFHLLGLINPALRTIKLPSELFNKKNTNIKIRIGKAIQPSDELYQMDTTLFGKFLRAKTYALGHTVDVKKFFKFSDYPVKKLNNIDEEVHDLILHNEINSLSKYKLFDWGDYDVYSAPTSKIPKIIQQIGVLREKTFRAVGEGTGKCMDLDQYDLYYEQLFIWDRVNSKIVGGYRIGKGKDILQTYKKQGFYLNSLFKFKKSFLSILNESIELGRSFVVEDYQKKAFPLFCLWKGIMMVLAKNPDYRYIIGPVSISNQYSDLSKSLMIDFLKTNYFDFDKAKMIKSRKKYKTKYANKDYRMFIDYTNNDLQKLDKLIDEIEGGKIKVPVLFKKYLAQNAKIIGFNQDPKFNNALDGLMILDVNDIPLKTVQSLTQNKNEYHTYLYRFYSQYTDNYLTIPQL